MKKVIFTVLITCFSISGFAIAQNMVRGIVPTIRLIQDNWSGVDLSNYFHLNKNKAEVSPDIRFSFFISNDSLWIKPSQQIIGYTPVRVSIGNSEYTLMTRTEYNYHHKFQYIDETMQAKEVFVMGNFNNWNRRSHPLTYQYLHLNWQRKDRFSAGKYEYKFVVDGKEVVDPACSQNIPNGLGGYNSTFKYGDYLSEELCLVKQNWNEAEEELLFSGCGTVTHYGKNLEYLVLFNNQVLDDSLFGYKFNNQSGQNVFYVIMSNLSDGLLRIYVNGGNYLENHTLMLNGKPLSPIENPGHPNLKVIYSLMVDRFYNGEPMNDSPVEDSMVHPLANYMGGDLAGVTQKIEEGYFSDLGINTLWISPIMQGPDTSFTESIPPHGRYSGYHGYWPVNSRKVDDRFGNGENLKTLIHTAHQHDISVLLDFVSNHTHKDHPYYQNHREWYGKVELADGSLNIRNWSEEFMLTTWFETFLPSYDFVNSQAAIEKVVGDAVFWIEEYGFDGFRQDATKHVPHSFWKSLRNGLDKNFPNEDLFQIGETFGSDELISSFVNPGELDSQFNFSLYYLLRNHLIKEDIDFNSMHEGIRDNLQRYNPLNLMGNITSSHDQVRFIALADGQIGLNENSTERAYHNPPGAVNDINSYEKLFMFMAMNMALPGVPVVYYGEEIGMTGAGDPDNRRMMRFREALTEKELSLLLKMRKLISLRTHYPSFALGDWSVFYNIHIVGWLKSYFDEKVILLFNPTSEFQNETISIYYGDLLTSLLDNELVPINGGSVNAELAPYETKIFLVE
ncbi:MAG: alpha-amylase family glycosyl hydrolase [Candidatus Marinimicrobia bacterium]|nr:alpha-amylase family glycosyl hydrolase [Candidatus Neomarinimicrobiota bacterium]